MAASARKLGIFFLIFMAYLFILTFMKYISALFSYETRGRILRFRTTVMIQSVSLVMSIYIWRNLSTMFDRESSSKPDNTFSSIHAVIRSWNTLGTGSKFWRCILFGILFLCHCSYSTFVFFLSTDPYKIAIVFFIAFAITVQLFTGLVLTKLFTLIFKLFGFKERYFLRHRVRQFIVLIYAFSISSAGYYNSLSLPEIKEVTVPVKDLPAKLNGLTITFIPDIHIGPTVGRTRLERIINMVNYIQSDLVVIGGDLVDGPVSKLEKAVEPLEWINPKYGTYYVTGNHEYYTIDVHNWMKKLASMGIHVLHNENVKLPNKGDSVCLAGVNDPLADEYSYDGHTMDLDKALQSCDQSKPVIFIAHRPETAKLALDSSYRVDLVLSGHTHGGQIFPITVGAYLFNPYYAGLYKHGEISHVYVSMGTVYWGFPMRFGTRSEISVITLKPLE